MTLRVGDGDGLVFARVKRTVVRAQDLSLWYVEDGRRRRYLGDNAALLDERLSAEQRAAHVSWEYDFFYGFCTPDGKTKSHIGGGGGSSIHFASNNYGELRDNGEWTPGYIVHPPPPGTLVCGKVVRTDKGYSMSHWCIWTDTTTVS